MGNTRNIKSRVNKALKHGITLKELLFLVIISLFIFAVIISLREGPGVVVDRILYFSLGTLLQLLGILIFVYILKIKLIKK